MNWFYDRGSQENVSNRKNLPLLKKEFLSILVDLLPRIQILWNHNYNNILNVFLTNFRVIRQSHDLNIYKVWVSIIIPKSNVVNIPLWEPNSM